ncbi:hypothetical protein [Actinocrispum sp. NPDC049592]|uniref:hypothetical protein n=1 Tax=Actinocrispum sp. NPDC049592 TaxID=3154835 RepID=UPI003425B2ED
MILAKLVVAAALAGQGLSAPDSASVVSAGYSLGDTAFQVPGFHNSDGTALADIELTASVQYPSNIRQGVHPLVVFLHGQWETCADRQAGNEYMAALPVLSGPGASKDPAVRAQAEATIQRTAALLTQWPCAPGTPPMPSYRGFDYVGKELARHGYVVVSVSANGVNAGEGGQAADMARAALINKHLAMWQELSAKGTGPLAGKLSKDFRGHVDLNNVGTVGHSRGGRAVVYQAADVHRGQWPAGVTVKAVVPLAAAGYYAPDPEAPENDDYRITKIPFELLMGGCDPVTNPAAHDYFTNAAGRNEKRISQVLMHGANHNFLNVQWSPSSGQVVAHDDVERAAQLGQRARPQPGHCANTDTNADEKQLTEPQERATATTYLAAFLRRYLGGETAFDPLLTGQLHLPGVDVLTR